MSELPTGTVTFLFTDIEGSTKLAQEYPGDLPALLARHNDILTRSIDAHNGFVFQVVGDSYHAAFHNASDGLNAALDAQRMLHNEAWSPAPVRVRMGIHTGAAQLQDDAAESRYTGYATIALCQRVMSAGHGGQILISQTVHNLLSSSLPENTTLIDMGEHYLKDILQPQHLFQVSAPGLPGEFPAIRAQRIVKHNLPLNLTSFIGRRHELDEAQRKLASARLLTLIGPGGTGKTRLSLQIAGEQLPNFKDGVWLAELAPISDPAFIVSAIASIFELRELQNIPLIQIITDYLREKDLLLVMDNCEHIVETSAQIVDQLLHACPNLKIVASSREALGIDGETVYRVPSLKEDEATRLFIERATKADSRFHLTEHDASFVAQICSRLDGIPLAIELAAARIKIFSPEQIAARLDDRFKLLTGGSRTALPRQQTLRALIDWSYQSLNEVEQRALRQLVVFSGGWTIEGAESVLGESEALDGLMGLVNKSLVNVNEQDDDSRQSAGKVLRYYFLETIRQYAMEKLLESGEAEDARDRHLAYVMQISELEENRMCGTETQEWFDLLEIEHDNLRAALEWATSNHPEQALKLAYAVGGFWTVHDHLSEASTWCQTILERTKSLPGVETQRARVYVVLAWMSVTSGEHKNGRTAAEQAISLGKQTNDLSTVTRGYGVLALTSIFLGDFAAAQNAVAEGEALARQQGLKSELAFILSTRTQLDYVFKTNLDQARKNMEEAAMLAKEQGYRWASSFLAIGMAHAAAALGDLETARAKFTESGEIAKKMGNKRIVYMAQSEFAHLLREHGEIDEPLSIYKDLLLKWKGIGHRAAVAHELECIAYLLVRKEEPEHAATLLGSAETIRNVIDTPRTQIEEVEYQREVFKLREMLGEDNVEIKWNVGRGMTMDEAIVLAIQ